MISPRRSAFAMIAALASALAAGAACADTMYPPSDINGDNPPPAAAPVQTPVGHEGVLSSGPYCGVVSHMGDDRSIWLGHFTGGNVGPDGPIPGGVDWRNEYACFPSRDTCQAWQRDMLAQYKGLEGYRSCIVIR